MRKKSIRVLSDASRKSSENPGLSLEAILPVLDLITGLKAEIEAVSAEVGMTIVQRYLEQEIRDGMRHAVAPISTGIVTS